MAQSLGQSLNEYVLAALLVAVVAISGLTLMADNLALGLPDFMNRVFGSNNGPQIIGGFVPAIGNGSGLGKVIPPPPQGTEQVCFQNGMCFNVTKSLPPTEISPETTGGMGEKLIYNHASTLGQLANQIQQSDNPDPRLVQLITRLANQGHYLGDRQSQLAQTYKDSCPINRCQLNGKVDDNGNIQYSGYALSGNVDEGYNIPSEYRHQSGSLNHNKRYEILRETIHSQLTELKHHSDAVDSARQNFEENLAQLKHYLNTNPHAVSDTVRLIIDTQAQGIIEMAKGADTAPETANGSVDPARKVFVIDNTGNQVYNTSVLTHIGSNQICSQNTKTGACIRQVNTTQLDASSLFSFSSSSQTQSQRQAYGG